MKRFLPAFLLIVLLAGLSSVYAQRSYPDPSVIATLAAAGNICGFYYTDTNATAANTVIAVNGPALGAGATLTTVMAWGYQL